MARSIAELKTKVGSFVFKNKKAAMAGSTFIAAATVGLIMQSLDSGSPLANSTVEGPLPELEVADVQLTSSIMPDLIPRTSAKESAVEAARAPVPMPLAAKPEIVPASQSLGSVGGITNATTNVASCDVTLTATTAQAAMVELELLAPCQSNERFVLHHNGMMFSAVTGADGALQMTVPALNENAVFIVSFLAGEGAVARAEVADLADYGRAVVQWRGDAGISLHAREYGAAYFSEGHIHAASVGSLVGVTRGSNGMLHRFGDDAGPEALMAEVYTYPTGKSQTPGAVNLSVEAEITQENCETGIEAQTIQTNAGDLTIRDLTLSMPSCDTIGDFLVLNNLLQDMKLASR